jgi:ApaG protein
LIFRQVTEQIAISVEPTYLEHYSNPMLNHFYWSYTVMIDNESDLTLQLLKRSWRIVDSNGFIQEVAGEGVVGQKPIIRPGESYEYTSMANLVTRSGLMMGTYDMQTTEGQKLIVAIPAFSLDSPRAARTSQLETKRHPESPNRLGNVLI